MDPLSNNFDHCQSKNWHTRSKWFLKFTLNTNGLSEPSFGFFVSKLDLGEKYFQQWAQTEEFMFQIVAYRPTEHQYYWWFLWMNVQTEKNWQAKKKCGYM